MTRQLEEAVRVTHGLERNKHINKNNIEIDVKCLNRKDSIRTDSKATDNEKTISVFR